MTSYRYPGEQIIFLVTIALLLGILALTALPTLCLVPLAALVFFAMIYSSSQAHFREVARTGIAITRERAPQLADLVETCIRRLRPGDVKFFILPSQQLNAYTFGLSRPNAVVIYSPMLEVMDKEELQFVIGHELGHVALGHTWLNTLLGGMAGVPTTFGGAVILTLAFRWWNRACEFSCDRAGLIACGNLNEAVSALAQLAVGDINSQSELQQALKVIEQQDDSPINGLVELLSTHPMVAKRIKELQQYAASAEYQTLHNQISQR